MNLNTDGNKMNTAPNLRLIVIDDNPDIHRDFMKILLREQRTIKDEEYSKLEGELFDEAPSNKKRPNFEVDFATQGQEGLEKITNALKKGTPYALAFVDIRMPPGWDGIETIKHIWNVDKNIQIVICSAYADYTWEETKNQLGDHDNLIIIKKPFDSVTVRQLACALTKKWQVSQEVFDHIKSLEKGLENAHVLNQYLIEYMIAINLNNIRQR